MTLASAIGATTIRAKLLKAFEIAEIEGDPAQHRDLLTFVLVWAGPTGAGHFVKIVHNGIEYCLMAAYAEGFDIPRHANVGKRGCTIDAETTPLRNPEHYRYDVNLPEIAEV